MKNIIQLSASVLMTGLLTFSNFVNAQTYGKPIQGLGNMNTDVSYYGHIGNHEILSLAFTTTIGTTQINLYSYADKKKVASTSMNVEFNKVKYTAEEFFVKNGKLYAFFIGKNPKSGVATLYFQEFTEKLVQKGNAIEITTFPNAMDGQEYRKMLNTPLFDNSPVKYQRIDMVQNETSGNMVFTFSMKSKDELKISYGKAIVIDKDFKLIVQKEYKAKDPKNTVKIELHKMYQNNDVLFSFTESQKVKKEEVVSSMGMIFVPGNDEDIAELELNPSKKTIKNIIVSSNFDSKNTYGYAISSNEYASQESLFAKIYTYNPDTKNTSEINVDLGKGNSTDKNKKINEFKLHKLYMLENGEFLLHLESYTSGSLVLSISADGKVNWRKNIRNLSYGDLYNSTLSYLEDNNSYKLIFNTNNLDGTSLKEKTEKLSIKSVPAIATIDTKTGKTSYKALNAKGKVIGGVSTKLSQEHDNGVFTFRMNYDGKIQSVPVNFNK